MHSLNLRDPRTVAFINTVDFLPDYEGVVPVRFPIARLSEWQPGMKHIPRMPTSVELQFRAAAASITFRVRVLDSDGYGICAELYRGPNKLVPTWVLDHTSGDVQTLTFKIGRALNAFAYPAYPYRLVFPTHTLLEILAIELDDDAVVSPIGTPYSHNDLAAPGARPLTWVAHGDSITQGANTMCPTATWLELTARQLAVHSVNLGIGGHGKTEPEMARYLATRTDADLLSLHIGVNSTSSPGESPYAGRFETYLDLIRAGLPTTPIVVVSGLWSCRDELAPELINTVAIRAQQAAVCARRRATGDRHLHYIDGLSIGVRAQHLNGDLLHLNETSSMIYANDLAPHLAPIVAELRQPR